MMIGGEKMNVNLITKRKVDVYDAFDVHTFFHGRSSQKNTHFVFSETYIREQART